jgi:tripeptidyl-peptidase-1
VTDGSPPAGENNQTLTPDEIQAGTGQEANLDVQTVLGVTWPTPMTFVTVGGSPPFNSSVMTREPHSGYLLPLVAAHTDMFYLATNTNEPCKCSSKKIFVIVVDRRRIDLDYIDYLLSLPDNELPATVSTSYDDQEDVS